jgi:predicted DNA-binding transcriptional regulator YafY
MYISKLIFNDMKQARLEIDSEQARRTLTIYKMFLAERTMATSEVCRKMLKRFGGISKRSIQRDLKILKDEGILELVGSGSQCVWTIAKKNTYDRIPVTVRQSELLSFYMLKAYLGTFRGTTIESNLTELSKKLETLVPGTIFMEENFYGDQNIGYYDYRDKNEIIQSLIKHITEKNRIQIKYHRISDDVTKEYNLIPQFLYTFAGTTYLVAFNPLKQISTNFAIQNILSVKESYTTSYFKTEFDYNEFRNQRFAVFDGEIKKVVLKIKDDYVKYFTNRLWHPSQKIKIDTKGNFILTLKVPISPDITSWICQWGEAITVVEPVELKEKIISLLTNTIANYDGEIQHISKSETKPKINIKATDKAKAKVKPKIIAKRIQKIE